LRCERDSADGNPGGYGSAELVVIKGFGRGSQLQLEVWAAEGTPPPAVFVKECAIP
jgi:hypothetical protein